MKSPHYHLMTLCLVITFAAAAQNDDAPSDGTTRFYQFAAATSERKGKQALYISNLSHVDFFTDALPIPDSVVRGEMERQYTERLQRDYDGSSFTFATFLLQPDQEAVKKSYDAVIAEYKKKGCKVVRVKDFSYD